MARKHLILRSVAAPVLGYVTIVLATSFGFAPLGGIIHLDAPLRIHLLATLVAIGAGLAGGMVAAMIAPSRPLLHATAVLLLLAVDTTGVLLTPSPDPWWFELGGSATLMICTVMGGWLYAVMKQRTSAKTSPAI